MAAQREIALETVWLVRHAAVYVGIPKVACTSIKATLAPLVGVDLVATNGNPHTAPWPGPPPPAAMGPLFPGQFAFAFVRDPWDRLVSCYRDKIRGEERYARDIALFGYAFGAA